MKKYLLLMVGLLFIVGCSSESDGNAEDGDTTQWAMGTSSSGSSPYVLGSSISNVINKNSDILNLSAQVTGGYEENFSLIESGNVDVAQQNLYQYNLAYSGEGVYEGKEKKNVSALFNASIMPVQIAVLAESNIESYKDLEGTRFNMGAPRQATHNVASIYLDTIGLSKEKDIEAGVQSTGDAAAALRDDQQDAVFLLSNVPHSGLIETASTKPIDLVSIEGEMADKFIENLNNSVVKTTIPADTYEGQTEDVETVAFPIVLYVDESASEEVVYEFTKTFWENLEQLQEELPATENLTRDLATEGIQAPLHPGAEKYFKETGMME
ncbi:C4-dicarboxylate ABC transporter substrate-binding protein [Lentibacillus kapialis]|uniref:C4-dicarboxylate ABC transporter substrate-binding protein n=1 Tax=Lentibacillus kapialis TaxID=340214 RepID=A0A917UYX1_9BACI|nr:TAXI family TRAP transporter solute-binding subunit [Lentibacillus kapialis]GGJ98464.1 C4-dicarboxylate ABC transporter substrate-binding protein [Lentibacillus kapialis]